MITVILKINPVGVEKTRKHANQQKKKMIQASNQSIKHKNHLRSQAQNFYDFGEVLCLLIWGTLDA